MKETRHGDPRMRSSVFPRGAVLDGEIDGAGDLLVCGTIVGPIRLSGALTIEAGGLVRGNVSAHTIVIRGVLEGAANGETIVRLEQGSRMIGDARAERVVLVDGALLRGRVSMGTRSEPSHDVGTETRPEGVPAPRERVAAARTGDVRVPDRNVGARTRSRRLSELSSEATAVSSEPPRSSERWPQPGEQEPQTRKLPVAPMQRTREPKSEADVAVAAPAPVAPSVAVALHAPVAAPASIVAVATNAAPQGVAATAGKDVPARAAPVAETIDGPPPPRIPRLHGKRAKRKDEA